VIVGIITSSVFLCKHKSDIKYCTRKVKELEEADKRFEELKAINQKLRERYE